MGTFLDWRTVTLQDRQIDELKAAPNIVNTIRACRLIGAKVVLFEDKAQFRIYVDGIEQACETSAAVRKAMRTGFNAVWREELKGLRSNIASNISEDATQRRLGNLWRTDESWHSTTRKFAIKLCADMLPDAKNLYKWDMGKGHPKCTACELCYTRGIFGDIKHIFHCCPAVEGLISRRHNCLVEILRTRITEVASHKWNYIGEHGKEPPASVVPKNWRDTLEETPDYNDQNLPATKHYRPDMILVSSLCQEVCRVVIMDVQITHADTEVAESIKEHKYQNLANLIGGYLGEDATVEIVPVIFTARGLPSTRYTERLTQLGICNGVGGLTKKIQKTLFEENKIIFDAWRRHDSSPRV